MSLEISPDLLERIDQAHFAWFTTVREDGMPQPTPVWFIRDLDSTFLIYSQPDAQKVRNLQQNGHVALSFACDEKALKYIVVMGEAALDVNALPMHLNVEYLPGAHIQSLFDGDSDYAEPDTRRLIL